MTSLTRSRTSPAISETEDSLLDSVSTTVKKTGGTEPSSLAAATTPSTKGTGATSRPALSKSLTLPSAVRCPTTSKYRSPANFPRPSSPMPKYSSSRSVASFRSLESTFYVALTGLLNGKHLRRTSTPLFSLSVSLSGTSMPALASLGPSSSCLEGSQASEDGPTKGSSQSTRRAYESYRARHTKLVDDGSIAVDGLTGTLTRDVPFSLPSTAGAIATGRSCNGRTAWKRAGGTYGDWENRDLDSSSTAPAESLQP